MIVRVLSLDVSSSSTGWSFMFGAASRRFNYGLIKTNSKFSLSERLNFFRNELQKLLLEFRPTNVVIEDIYAGPNTKTLIMLSKFLGVAEECCFNMTGVQPYLMSTNTVKSYFKSKNKEDVFNSIVDLLDWENSNVSFKKHNDLTDSIAQLIVYYDLVLEYRKFRFEKEYGYLYEV